MLLKNFFGVLIIVLNIAGLGYVLYLTGMMLKNKLFPQKQIISDTSAPVVEKKTPKIVNDDVVPDEDDLLKDMDLSDLDNLDLDDFE